MGGIGVRGLCPGLPGFLLAQAGSMKPTLTPLLPLRPGCRPPSLFLPVLLISSPAGPLGWEPHLQAPVLTVQNCIGSCLVSLLSRTFPLTIYLTPGKVNFSKTHFPENDTSFSASRVGAFCPVYLLPWAGFTLLLRSPECVRLQPDLSPWSPEASLGHPT